MPNGNLASIPAPASTAGFCDSRGSSPYSASGGSGPWDYPSVEGQVDGRRHPGINTANSPDAALTVAFLDGHAKFVRLNQVTVAPPAKGNIWTVRDDD